MGYDTIRYDSVYLTCSKKLTGSQLSPPHGTNKKLKCETKNKTMNMIGPVQSRCHEGSPDHPIAILIGTLAVDGWTVSFGTAMRGLDGAPARPGPFWLY